MAIKIIVEGTLPKLDVYEGKCYYCKCEVECDESDFTPINFTQIRCPTCGKLMEVKKKYF